MRGGVLLACCLVACGDEPPPMNECEPDLAALHDPGRPNAEIMLGAGQYQFDELKDEGTIILIHGPQGGYHLPLNARIWGMEPGNPADYSSGPLTLFSVVDEAGTPLSYFPCAVRSPYVSADGDGFLLGRPQAMIIPNEMVPAIYGHRVRAHVEVLDRKGEYGIDEAWATVIADPPR